MKKTNRLFKKIAFRITVLFSAVIVVTGCVSYLYLNHVYLDRTEQTLLSEARMIAELAKNGEDIVQTTKAVEEAQGIRVTVVDDNGTVLIDTEADVSQLENHLDRPEIQQALKTGEGVNVRRSDTLGKDLMYVAVHIDKVGYAVRLAMPLEGISAYSRELWTPIIIMLILSFLLCLVISLLISRNITIPIVRMEKYASRIAHGEYDEVQRLRTGDEIEDLSAAMADMADVIKRNIADITEKNSRMQAIFKAVPGGVLAIDNHETVTMVNPAAQEMFSISQKPEGRHFMEVVRHAKLESVIRESLDKQAPVEREIIMQKGMEERFLHVIAVPVAGAGIAYGVILLAQDITRIRKLENMRSDFAANVSHELKTPLTVISGFIDTLKDPGISRKDTERFLEIISLESERLTRLIDDVLALSEIENTAVPPASVLDVRQSVREAAELLQNSAQLRHISLTLDTAKCRIPIAADNDRIKQMMINLIDNAIKYTPEGGSVHVSAEKKARSCVIRVADTGIGIPKENLPRLFERFYRVDKSRSREMGGTGLGLAIVKHIVNLLGGRITVQSEVGKGTVFEITIPLAQRDI